MVSLLHDIGYPIEIVFNQLKHYVEDMIGIDNKKIKPVPYFEYKEINKLFYMHDNSGKSFINYLSENIAQALDLDIQEVADDLLNYENIKGTSGYIDHGFYSSIIMLRWNGLLLEKTNQPIETFEKDIVDAATAILLHNYYKRPLQDKHKLPPLKAQQHPLAFMIILCDELQE